jgi:hypothetical protein
MARHPWLPLQCLDGLATIPVQKTEFRGLQDLPYQGLTESCAVHPSWPVIRQMERCSITGWERRGHRNRVD